MSRALATLLLAAALAFALPVGTAAAEAPPPSILLDGFPLQFPVPPTIVEGRTLVPFRALAEALGTEVTWHEATRTVEAQGYGKRVRLTIGEPVMWVDGSPLELSVPPMIVEGRTLIPLRAFGTAFGAHVDWNNETRTVLVDSPPRPMRALAYYAIRSYSDRTVAPWFSDVAFGWARLTASGTVDFSGAEYRWPQPDGEITGERILSDIGRSGTRRHLMIHATDRDGAMTALVLDANRTREAAAAIARAVTSRGFEGVVVDIEGLGLTETGDELDRIRQGFASLIAAVAGQLRPAGRETLVAVHPLNGAYYGYDYAALGRSADSLLVMAHDYRQDGEPEPLVLVDEAVRLSLEHVDRTKLMLALVTAYESAESIPQKVGLAKRYGLAGITVWRLGALDDRELTALQQELIPQK